MRSKASLVLILSLALAAPATAATKKEDGGWTLHGIYTSGFSNGPQRLRADFTPGDGEHWKVSFHFRWSGDDRVYTGVAKGGLSVGSLHGRVRNEDGTRIFTFYCEFDKKKRCKGKHAEVVRTGEHETGEITLKATGRAVIP